MKINIKEKIIRIIILFVGLVIAHLGVTLFILADLGSDPFNVLIQGLYRFEDALFGISWLTHGRVHMCICFLIILILLVVDRSYIKLGTLVCMFFGGPIIDVFSVWLSPLVNGDSSMVIRVIANILGCVILAYGMTIVIKSDAGTGPNDLVAVVISDKIRKKFSIIRVIVDIGFALIGTFLGGTIGAGTVICAFLVGPVAGIFLPINEKMINKILTKILQKQ